MTKPPRGRPRGGFVRAGRVLGLACALAAWAASARAQVVRGTVRVRQTSSVVAGARVSAHDSTGRVLHEVTTDSAGRFTLRLVDGAPFTIAVRKLGWRPSYTDLIRDVAPADTVDLDLEIPAEPPTLPEVEVVTAPVAALNARRLDEARRHGWKVIPPDVVEQHRAAAHTFTDLLHATQVQSLVFPTKANDCYRSSRTGRCLTIVIDDQVMGTTFAVAQMQVVTSDIYFFAVLSAAQAGLEWGDQAPWGAIAIYTRSYADRRKP